MRIVNPIAVKGEDLAVEFLQKKGYKVIERNFRKRYGEIDIIALFANSLIPFAEIPMPFKAGDECMPGA